MKDPRSRVQDMINKKMLMGRQIRSNINPPNKIEIKKFEKHPLKETIAIMINILDKERQNPFVIDTARDVVSRRCPANPDDPTFVDCRIINIFNYVKNNVRYEFDPLDIEYVTYPSKMIERINITRRGKNGNACGDCDDHAILLASLLVSVGIPARFVVISQSSDSDFHHIYTEAYNIQTGNWIPLDAIYKHFEVGQVVDNIQKRKVFDIGIVEQV